MFMKENELYHGLIVCPSQLEEAGAWRAVSLHHTGAQLWTFVLAT